MFLRLALIFCIFFPIQSLSYQNPEQRVLKALSVWQQGYANKAENILSSLLLVEPEFRLAHLLRADILRSKTTAIKSPAEGLNLDSEQAQQLLLEVKSRWLSRNKDFFKNKIPASIIKPNHYSRYIFAIDLQLSRLYVFENKIDKPKLLHDYYISMGRGGADKKIEGDLRTPLGVYFVQNFLSPAILDDKYGAGAYPLNYPNAWDKFNQRTGRGIWLHGTRSGTYNRPPLASEGCVVLPNNDLIEVAAYIDIGQTTVIIADGLNWLSVDAWRAQKTKPLSYVQQWLSDWQSLNAEVYLKHYSTKFSGDDQNYKAWSLHKKNIFKKVKFLDIKIENLSVFKHPNQDVLIATFQQKYRSDTFVSSGWKRQYWQKEADGEWRIIFEGKVAAPLLASEINVQLDAVSGK